MNKSFDCIKFYNDYYNELLVYGQKFLQKSDVEDILQEVIIFYGITRI